ncbi:hypothetical protein IAU59_007579 [Kwoniella sp. CBS 9459]
MSSRGPSRPASSLSQVSRVSSQASSTAAGRPQSRKDLKVVVRHGGAESSQTVERDEKELKACLGARSFHKVLPVDSTQEDFYSIFEDDIEYALEHGQKVVILAYGCTGSGKTHSIVGRLGDQDGQGLLPRSATAFFQASRRVTDQLLISGHFVYRGKVFNLFGHGGDQGSGTQTDNIPAASSRYQRDETKLLTLAEPTKQKQKHTTFETNPQEAIPVQSLDHLADLLKSISRQVITKITAQNQAGSSRGHTVYTLGFRKSTTKLCLVDLAGSEDVQANQGDEIMQAEGISINQESPRLHIVGTVSVAEGTASRVTATLSFLDKFHRLRPTPLPPAEGAVKLTDSQSSRSAGGYTKQRENQNRAILQNREQGSIQNDSEQGPEQSRPAEPLLASSNSRIHSTNSRVDSTMSVPTSNGLRPLLMQSTSVTAGLPPRLGSARAPFSEQIVLSSHPTKRSIGNSHASGSSHGSNKRRKPSSPLKDTIPNVEGISTGGPSDDYCFTVPESLQDASAPSICPENEIGGSSNRPEQDYRQEPTLVTAGNENQAVTDCICLEVRRNGSNICCNNCAKSRAHAALMSDISAHPLAPLGLAGEAGDSSS